jgi:hypothetical protein
MVGTAGLEVQVFLNGSLRSDISYLTRLEVKIRDGINLVVVTDDVFLTERLVNLGTSVVIDWSVLTYLCILSNV